MATRNKDVGWRHLEQHPQRGFVMALRFLEIILGASKVALGIKDTKNGELDWNVKRESTLNILGAKGSSRNTRAQD